MISPLTGIIVDCGSGHTAVTCYSHSAVSAIKQTDKKWLVHLTDKGNLPLTDIIPGSAGEAFQSKTLLGRLDEFMDSLEFSLKEMEIPSRDILFVGATGGVRAAMEEDRLSNDDVAAINEAFVSRFSSYFKIVRFEVLSGSKEAVWEHAAAQTIWGGQSSTMFPQSSAGSDDIGLFSGGGKSMQLGRKESCLSFPFSTFPKELEERQGAHPDAWLDPEKWDRFENALTEKIKTEATLHAPFVGKFVGTAMNHRAAKYSEISETPISAGDAVKTLKINLPLFRQKRGELYEKMMATRSPGSTYPMARIVAMHTLRLLLVLETMFSPEASLFFAKHGFDEDGKEIECEWTVGAMSCMANEARSKKAYVPEVLSSQRKAELTDCVTNWHKEDAPPLHLEPTLTADERKFVHAFCESRGEEMSSKSEGKGAERHVVVYPTPVEKGIVRGVTEACRLNLTKRIDDWMKENSEPLHFEPTLTPAEREFIHHLAAKLNLKSKSEGMQHGVDKHMVVRRI
ncbi:hypothetical protein TL16_g03225 [Triparma laevis f. inornata]|uniref:R3H domain-containing protein n=1 Tax=Triparma laevis f. inornata TaxID=1714386 RepID=A0A9W7A251_9STRA|nr:hypothetical protein TL16_g03225 [Triparma laevis f. inornata]